MGKKSKAAKPAAPAGLSANLPSNAAPEDVQKRATELKEEAGRLFTKNEYDLAITAYESAITLLADPKDKAMCHNNKAACLMKKQKYTEAIKETSAALTANPALDKALIRRARCYEHTNRFDLALADLNQAKGVQSAAGGQVSKEVTDADERIKNVLMKQLVRMHAHKDAAAQGGQAAAGQQKQRAAAQQAQQQRQLQGPPARPPFPVKLCLGEDIRLATVPAGASYAELISAAKDKFPDAGACALKYQDKDGDLITITSQADISRAQAEASGVKSSGAGPALPPKPGSAQAPLKVFLSKMPDGQTAPPPPASEVRAAAAERAAAARAAQGIEAADELELDDWMFEFAQLFRQQLGIDWDGYVDLHNEGMEKCNAALESTMAMDEALPLFEQSAAKFQEVAALALFNWGNVHMCCARRLEARVGEGGELPMVEMKAEYAKAEERYKASLGVKADFYEAAIAWGQEMFEHAKLLTAKEDKRREASKDGKFDRKAHDEIEGLFAEAQAKFEGALAMLPPEPKGKPSTEEEEVEAENTVAVKSQVVVMWGNVLFEQSQMKAMRGEPFEPLLDEAVAKFKEAGCTQEDIDNALAGHVGNKDKPKAEGAAAAAKPAAKSGGGDEGAKFDPLGGGDGKKKTKKKKPEKKG